MMVRIVGQSSRSMVKFTDLENYCTARLYTRQKLVSKVISCFKTTPLHVHVVRRTRRDGGTVGVKTDLNWKP